MPDLLELLQQDGVRMERRGNAYWGLCPFHVEKTPSFKVEMFGGKLRYRCFSCHAKGDAITYLKEQKNMSTMMAMDIAGNENWKASNKKPHEKPAEPKRWISKLPSNMTARYIYRDARSKTVIVVQRYEKINASGKREKFFGQYTWFGKRGEKEWYRGLPKGIVRPLYRLPELMAADPSKAVYVVEGEKCADTLVTWRSDLVVTCWIGGSVAPFSKKASIDWTPLYGRPLVLVADGSDGWSPQAGIRGDDGHGCMIKLAEKLEKHCGEIKLILPPAVRNVGEPTLDIADEIEQRPKGVVKWLKNNAFLYPSLKPFIPRPKAPEKKPVTAPKKHKVFSARKLNDGRYELSGQGNTIVRKREEITLLDLLVLCKNTKLWIEGFGEPPSPKTVTAVKKSLKP